MLLKVHSRFWSCCVSYIAQSSKGFTWQHHLAFLSETANLHFEHFAYSKISSSPLSHVFPKIMVKVLLNCAKFHTDILNIHLLSVGRNPIEPCALGSCTLSRDGKTWGKEEIPCKRQNLMLFRGDRSKPLILYSVTSKANLGKCLHPLKHTEKSEETLESGQLDGRKEQPALTSYNRFYCLKQKLCHQCSPSRALELHLDRASLIFHTAWNSGQPLSQQYRSTQYYCSNTT